MINLGGGTYFLCIGQVSTVLLDNFKWINKHLRHPAFTFLKGEKNNEVMNRNSIVLEVSKDGIKKQYMAIGNISEYFDCFSFWPVSESSTCKSWQKHILNIGLAAKYIYLVVLIEKIVMTCYVKKCKIMFCAIKIN